MKLPDNFNEWELRKYQARSLHWNMVGRTVLAYAIAAAFFALTYFILHRA